MSGVELLERAAGAADLLDELGAPDGVPAAALVTSTAPAFALAIGATGSGRPLAPLGPRLTVDELARCVHDLGAAVVLAEPEFIDTAREVGARTGARAAVLEVPGRSERALDLDPAPDALVVILHTSGTTGSPRPVPYRQDRFALRVGVHAPLCELTPGRRFASASPFHHIAGFGNHAVALASGASVIAFPALHNGRVASARGRRDHARARRTHRHRDAARRRCTRPRHVAHAAVRRGTDPSRDARPDHGRASGRPAREPVRSDRRQPDHLPQCRGPRAGCRRVGPSSCRLSAVPSTVSSCVSKTGMPRAWAKSAHAAGTCSFPTRMAGFARAISATSTTRATSRSWGAAATRSSGEARTCTRWKSSRRSSGTPPSARLPSWGCPTAAGASSCTPSSSRRTRRHRPIRRRCGVSRRVARRIQGADGLDVRGGAATQRQRQAAPTPARPLVTVPRREVIPRRRRGCPAGRW